MKSEKSGLEELQVSLTNSCSFNCKHCYKYKENPSFVDGHMIDKIIKIAKENDTEAIRFTGGDIFEHRETRNFLEKVKNEGIKTIVNITSYRLEKIEEIVDLCDYVLLSFNDLNTLKDLGNKVREVTEKHKNTIFMGCMVFKGRNEDTDEILKEASNLGFFSFFFLRDIRASGREYFININRLAEKIEKYKNENKPNTEIKIANAFPLCYTSINSINSCEGKRFDDGNTRAFIDEEGNIKLNSYSSKTLGNIDNLKKEGEDFTEIIKKERDNIKEFLENNELCKRCKIKEFCGGGIFSKEENSQDYFSKFQEEAVTKKENFSPLQITVMDILPESDFEADYKKIYFRNSDFLMQYPNPKNWETPISFEEFDKNISKEKDEWGLYLHFPFCNSRCKFCGVKKYRNNLINSYVDFMIKQIEKFSHILKDKEIKYIYMGGGSPTIIGLKNFRKIFNKLFQYLDKDSLEEVTLKLFPKNFDKELFDYLSKYVTRVSIGIHCLDDRILKRFNRLSTVKGMKDFIKKIKEYGFVTNFDIIYGLYLDDEEKYEKDIKEILSFNPDNITFQPLHNYKKITQSDEIFFSKYVKILEKLNRKGRNILRKNDYIQYTMEDFHKKGKSKFLHQINFLNEGNILGLGIDTFSYFGNSYYLCKNPNKWFSYKLNNNEELLHELSLKSRLLYLDIEELNQKYKIDYELMFSNSLNYLIRNNLIKIKNKKIQITEEGKGYVDFISQILMINNIEYKLK